jgi:hypothetical protein
MTAFVTLFWPVTKKLTTSPALIVAGPAAEQELELLVVQVSAFAALTRSPAVMAVWGMPV